MKKRKYINNNLLFLIIFILIIVTVFNFNSSAYAKELNINTSPNYIWNNYDIQILSANRHSNIWNVSTKGKKTLSGSITKSDITRYSNYKFTGKNNYTITIKNTGTKKLYVKVKTLLKTYISISILPKKSKTIPLSNMDKSTAFYLTFKGKNSGFYGYIK